MLAARSVMADDVVVAARRSVSWLLLFGVAVVAWFVVAVVLVFPGSRNWDSFEQLQQGLSGEYRTTFTIAYAWLLGRSFELTGTVGGLWIMQLLLLLGCFVWLVDRARARLVVVVVAVVFLLFPPLWAGMVQHWRDTWVAAFFLLAFCGAVARAPLVVVFAVIAAIQFRSNAVVFGVPVLAVAARDLLVPPLRARFGGLGRLRKRVAIALGVVAFVGMSSLTSAVIANALHAIPGFPVGPSLLFDLADIWRRAPQTQRGMKTPKELIKRAVASVSECDSHTVVDGTVPELEVKQLAGRKDQLLHDWKKVVTRRPDVWLKHRMRAVECMLRIDYVAKPPWRFGYSLLARGGHGLGRYDLRAEEAPLLAIQDYFWNSWMPLFDPKLWLALFAVVGVVAIWRTRPRAPVAAFVVGNWLFVFSNFLVAPSPNLRYLFPMLPSLAALAIVAVAGRNLVRGRASKRRARVKASDVAAPVAADVAASASVEAPVDQRSAS